MIFIFCDNCIASTIKIDHELSLCNQSNNPCTSGIEVSTKRELSYQWTNNKKSLYVAFSTQLDFTKLSTLLSPNPSHARIKLQKIAAHLNKESVNSYIKENLKNEKRQINHIEYFAVNNSAVFYFGEIKKQPPRNYLKAEILNSDLVVALLDSGVSTNHEKLINYEVTQFNSEDRSYGKKDTGLGHATGILSLLELKKETSFSSKESNVSYLSCNGITDGKYHFINALRCFNWLFLQPKVDVMLNAWLVSEPGCKSEWNYPIQMIWLSGTIPVFAAGNNGRELEQSYSPANLASLGADLPLISVGSLSATGQRLKNSSQALSQCGLPHPLTSLYANGENLQVAVPFQFKSYQVVSGTSYAIAFVANALLELKSRFPKSSNRDLVLALYNSAKDLGGAGFDNEYGFGKLDLAKATELLEKNASDNLPTAIIER